MIRSRSFAAMVVGAVLMIGSRIVLYSYFRPAPPPFDGMVWIPHYSPAQKALIWTGGVGTLLFVAGLLSLAIDGVKRLRKKQS